MTSKSVLKAAACALFASSASVAATFPSRVDVESGALQGVARDDVLSFKGIPYAAPPVGPLRWRAPQPASKWVGIREAVAYGHDCAQKPFPSDAAPLGTQPAEDCLVLNVWRPSQAAVRSLPVMVWIYGGGFVNGGSSPAVYDGSQFARGGIVFVSFNYRLGRLGFFAHPALTQAAPPDEPLGNYGYMDQIGALKWIQRNIAAFGGDPRNVTIFGESAGGMSVHALLSSPIARDLFHKAIIQSGAGRGPRLPVRKLREDLPGLASAESVGVAFAKANGIDGQDNKVLAALRALPADSVVNGLNLANMGTQAATYVGGPVIDGEIVLEAPEIAYRSGRVRKVPIIVGANSADIGFVSASTKDELFATFGARADVVRRAYDPEGSLDVRAIAAAIGMDQLMTEPARLTAQLFAAQGLPAYQYRFSYVAESMRKTWTSGAPHATEIPFVFDTVAVKYGEDLTSKDADLARAIHAYWANFVKMGDPNGPGLPTWSRYAADSDQILDFTATGPEGKPDPWKPRLDVIAAAADGGTSTAP